MADLRPVGEPHHLLDQRFAPVVGRVRLPSHYQLDRPLFVEQQLLEPIGIAQHQRQPLVGRDRRAKPTVSTFGSNAVAIQPSSASVAPRSSHDCRNRARTSSTSIDRSCERIHHR